MGIVMFIGRKAELAELEMRYNQNGFQFSVIYGRRWVGKMRLIQEFISDKKSVYFIAARQTSSELLQGGVRDNKRTVFWWKNQIYKIVWELGKLIFVYNWSFTQNSNCSCNWWIFVSCWKWEINFIASSKIYRHSMA